MLNLLRIRNFVIIDSLEIELKNGLNAVTGETGAGKSILLDAISLVLGARANIEVIRTGSEEATVEAVFDLKPDSLILQKLKDYDFPIESELLIKRTIHRSGKNKIFINGSLATLSQLSELCSNLVELCSQHEHQSLTKTDVQLELLDRYGGLSELRAKVSKHFEAFQILENELNKLKGIGLDARTEDFLRFQLAEIREFNPQMDEEENLLIERKKLQNVGHLSENVNFALAQLEQSDGHDVGGALGRSINRIQKACEADSALKPALDALNRAQLEVSDAVSELSTYLNQLESDPAQLENLEDRLAAWSLMKKKYGADAKIILDKADQIEYELSAFENKSEKISELESKIENALKSFNVHAQELSKKRKTVAKTLSKTIQNELAELSMPNTEFKVEFEISSPNANGIDHLQFLFSPNPGETAKPISKVASGGELSRIMLAVRRTIADKGTIGVYLFDEIDAGIGGHTGSVVGRKLKSVSKFNQIICITHLPQVAAFADAHFHVSKKIENGRTISFVDELKEKDRVEEIARMLGGMKVTEKSRAHAKDLLKEAIL